jgi:hypothetical protein
MSESSSTSITSLMGDLDGGVFEQKIGRALSDVAAGIISTGKKGHVTIRFDMEQISESNQVAVSHKLTLKKPTRRGMASEEDTTKTPMHVGRGGKLTLMPDTQTTFEFTKSPKSPAGA